MLNALHDEVDLREDLQERAIKLVGDTVRDNFDKVLTQTGNFEEMFGVFIALVANELADLTTEAVQRGGEAAVLRIMKMEQ